MTSVLIPTTPDDEHAIAIFIALSEAGHQCTLWHTADFPSQQCQSLYFNETLFQSTLSGTDAIDLPFDHDVVWLRRPKGPILPTSIYPDDFSNAKKENDTFYNSIWHTICSNSFWINNYLHAKQIQSKPFQLKLAATTGLTIPDTLISNNPTHIKDFIKHKKSVVYKTLHPHYWFEEKTMALVYTSNLSIEELPDDDILQSTPGIFQKKIEKSFELRITYFGTHHVAVKIESQCHANGLTDWRYIPLTELKIELFNIPNKLDEFCQYFMRKAGIVFGCFDFIVTPNNDFIFLEVNEQGQFLWIEDINPEIKMLDTFKKFILNKAIQFSWSKAHDSISLHDINNKIQQKKDTLRQVHLSSSF